VIFEFCCNVQKTVVGANAPFHNSRTTYFLHGCYYFCSHVTYLLEVKQRFLADRTATLVIIMSSVCDVLHFC